MTKLLAQNNLDNIKLKGDVILREIRVQLPTSSFNATMIGCGLLVLLALLVVFVVVRRVEYFTPEASKAEEFVEMSKDEKYPDVVHDKMLYFPESGKEVRFSVLKVDRMTLRHRLEQHR